MFERSLGDIVLVRPRNAHELSLIIEL
jgi:hypothetical protein